MGRSLEGQVAIVTGGGQGIGRGICLCLAEDGADVVVMDRDFAAATSTAGEVEAAGRRALPVKADVTKPDEVAAMVGRVLDRFGRIDILVNNAGIGIGPNTVGKTKPGLDDWDACYEVNLRGTVICCEAVTPHMMEQKSGKIVNISSIAGRKGGAMLPHYGASKAGVINWTQSLALLMAPYGVRVNAICPGHLWTPLWQHGVEVMRGIVPGTDGVPGRDLFLLMANANPLGREQDPEDIGYAVCFFVSDRAKNITGQTLNVDGGLVMS